LAESSNVSTFQPVSTCINIKSNIINTTSSTITAATTAANILNNNFEPITTTINNNNNNEEEHPPMIGLPNLKVNFPIDIYQGYRP
jgi:hypothetical protein